jgi:hypothetical protein
VQLGPLVALEVELDAALPADRAQVADVGLAGVALVGAPVQVRPSAPASRHAWAATRGDGLSWPRELRRSATLLRLTERLTGTRVP